MYTLTVEEFSRSGNYGGNIIQVYPLRFLNARTLVDIGVNGLRLVRAGIRNILESRRRQFEKLSAGSGELLKHEPLPLLPTLLFSR